MEALLLGAGDDDVVRLIIVGRGDLGMKLVTSDRRISGQRRDAYVIKSVRAFHSRSLAF